MRPILPAVLLLAVVASTLPTPVAACSFVEEPPGPGAFYVWDPDSGREWRVPVESRMLGAGCELSNPVDYSDGRLVWTQPGSSDRMHAFQYDLRTQEGRPVVLAADPAQVGLVDDLLVYTDQDDRFEEVRAHDLATGRPVFVPPIAEVQGVRVQINHGAVLRTDLRGGAPEYSVYDVEREGWTLRDATNEELGVPGDAYLAAFSGGWLVFARGDDAWAVLGGGRAVNDVSDELGGGWILGIDDATVLFRRGDALSTLRLSDGERRDLGDPPEGDIVGFHDGIVVFGVYSAVEGRGTDEPFDVSRGAPPVAVGVLLAGLALAAFVRRPRAG